MRYITGRRRKKAQSRKHDECIYLPEASSLLSRSSGPVLRPYSLLFRLAVTSNGRFSLPVPADCYSFSALRLRQSLATGMASFERVFLDFLPVGEFSRRLLPLSKPAILLSTGNFQSISFPCRDPFVLTWPTPTPRVEGRRIIGTETTGVRPYC